LRILRIFAAKNSFNLCSIHWPPQRRRTPDSAALRPNPPSWRILR
jgi:hypothetical protein